MKGTYVEINLDNIKHNVSEIKKKYSNYDYYIGVVKGDAYGHGEYVSRILEESGINYLAVSSLREAHNVRKYNKDIPILLLEPIHISELKDAIDNNLTLVIHELSYAKELVKKIKKDIKVHIKIDSGMGRLGFTDKYELRECYNLLSENKYISVEGIYSHFATIGLFDKRWDIQLERFRDITSLINIYDIPIRHMGSSITLLSHPKIDFCNGVRSATLIFGYNISISESNVGLKNKLRMLRNRIYQKKYKISECYTNVEIDVKNCMRFYTDILTIKTIKSGDYIGYGAKVKVEKDTKIAVLPVGYDNGIGIKNINRYVLINGKRYNVLCGGMNMMTIEVDDSVSIDDKVTLMDGKNIQIGTLGRFGGKTMHEVMLDIGKNNIRVYTKNGEIEYIEE